MTSREQTLAYFLIAAVLLIVGGVGGYMFVYQPLEQKREAAVALEKDITGLEQKLRDQQPNAQKMAVARTRSLPINPALGGSLVQKAHVARDQYHDMLRQLLTDAGITPESINEKAVDNTARYVPELSKGKPIYNRVVYEIEFKRADMWAVRDFLEGYYELGLLHQITFISIKKDDDPTAKGSNRRNDLHVKLTTEAIIVDGADTRRTLLPIPSAFAALGGGAGLKAIGLNPKAGRAVTPQLLVPVLSTHNRDYSLMVLKDPFSGPLSPPPAFKLDPISNVKITTDEQPPPVKVSVKGEGSAGVKLSAITAGALFAPGSLKVDPKALTILLPKTSATEGESTVEVTATSAEGATQKTTFKVSLNEKKIVVAPPPPPKPGVEFAILLIGTTPRSDGTAWARIRDNANRVRYNIEATSKGITVTRDYTLHGDKWKENDIDHRHPPGIMVISDDTSSTNRTFKVIAVEGDAIIVADLKPDGTAAAPPKKGSWPPRPGQPPKQGPAHPLAAVGGNMAVAIRSPKYYRWTVGQSLAEIKPIPDDEVKKILKQVADTGPVFEVASTGN